MDFSIIISRAYQIVKKYRYLIWLGILAGLTEGGFAGNIINFSSLFNPTNSKKTPNLNPSILNYSWDNLWQYAWPYIIVIFGTFLLILILIIYVSNASRAVLIINIDNIEEDRHHKKRFKEYFQKGIPYIWPLFCVDFIITAVMFVILSILFTPVLLSFIYGHSTALYIIGGIMAMVGLILTLLFTIYLGIVQKYASRILILEKNSIVDSIKQGLKLTRFQFENSLIAMLINIGLGLGFSFALLVILSIIGLVLFGIGYAIFMVANFALVIIYAVLATLVLIGIYIIIGGIFSTFIGAYWTLVYRAATYLASKKLKEKHGSK